MTVEFVQRELAGGPGASLLGGGSADGLASYVLEWTEREKFSLPAANLKPREIGQPPPQRDFTNVYLGFRRVRPKALHGVARLRTGGGKCVVCLPKLLEDSVDGGSRRAASCAVCSSLDLLGLLNPREPSLTRRFGLSALMVAGSSSTRGVPRHGSSQCPRRRCNLSRSASGRSR